MKKLFTIIGLFLLFQTGMTQDFRGIHSSRFFPLQNISNQPADLVRTDARLNVNVLSANIGLVNDFAFNEQGFIKLLGKAGFRDLKYIVSAERSFLAVKGRVILPSFAFKYDAKNAFAFSMHLRVDGIYRSSNDELLQLFQGISHPEGLENLTDEYFKSVVNQWMEYSLSWSRVLMKKDEHLLTGGLNLKYLIGGGAGYVDLDGIRVKYGRDRIDYFDVVVSYAINKNLANTIDEGRLDLYGDNGIGADLGLSYSFLPEGRSDIPYLYKLGFTIRDLGFVRYRSQVNRSSFHVSIQDVDYNKFKGLESIAALIDSLQSSVSIVEIDHKAYTMKLPTSYILTSDYCLSPSWYLASLFSYQNGYYSNLSDVARRTIWTVGLTPRFENSKWGVYLPLFWNSYTKSAGFALRWKSFYLGSGSLVGNLFSSKKGRGEIYFGVNVPIGKADEYHASSRRK